MAEFKIGFSDYTITTTIIIRLTTDTAVMDKTVGSQLCQNFGKFDFISIIIFIYFRTTSAGNLSISIKIYIYIYIYVYYSNYAFLLYMYIYIRFEKDEYTKLKADTVKRTYL